jgi:hypothetical protein
MSNFDHHYYAGAAEAHKKEVRALHEAAMRVGRCEQWLAAVDYMKRLEEENERTGKKLSESLDVLCSCANQFLFEEDDGTITHSFMSTEEHLCAFLVKHGRMEQVSRGRFRMVPSATDHRAEVQGESK